MPRLSSPQQRFVRGATSALLSWQPLNADGDAGTVTGAVTVAVTRGDGTTIGGLPAVAGTGSAVRTVTLPASALAELDQLTASWSIDGTAVATTLATIVGGVYLTAAQLRTLEPALVNATTYPDARLRAVRAACERECEDIAGVAFVPQYAVTRLTGRGRATLLLPHRYVRRVRWARVYDCTTLVETLSAGALASIGATVGEIARRTDGGVWHDGCTVEIGYEHGLDSPPEDLLEVFPQLVRARVTRYRSAIPDGAQSVQMPEGGTLSFARPGAPGRSTGIDAVDWVLWRYTDQLPGIA